MTGVILSGGSNRRMGENKAFLRVEGEPLIDRIVRLFRGVFKEVIIVTSSPLDYLDQEVVIVTDILPEKGALGGIYTGLFYAAEEHAFIAACDMPFLNRAFLEYMVRQTAGYDIIVPAPPDGLQPLHAVYARRDYKASAPEFQCLTSSSAAAAPKPAAGASLVISSGNLRTYRLACAATAESTAY